MAAMRNGPAMMRISWSAVSTWTPEDAITIPGIVFVGDRTANFSAAPVGHDFTAA